MNDDDMVTLEVRVSRYAALNLADASHGPMGDAARAWVAANDRPERRRYFLGERDDERNFVALVAGAVAVEDLEPGDRVAGREVAEPPTSIINKSTRKVRIEVTWDDGKHSDAFPGTLVVLDGDQ